MSFVARHVRRTGTLSLPFPAEEIFPLFTPEGERLWIDDWDPEYLYPPDGTLAPGLAFRTRADNELTLWLVSRFDADAMEAEFVRIVPDSRMGTVFVRCQRVSSAQSTVEVTYSLTALSETGNQALAALTVHAYADMIADWRNRILALHSEPRRPL